MTDSALESTAAWLLLDLARAGTTNVAHKRRAQDPGDSVLGDDAAQLVRGYSSSARSSKPNLLGRRFC